MSENTNPAKCGCPLKKKSMMIVAAIIILALLVFAVIRSMKTDILAQSFPENGTIVEQCTFYVDYRNAVIQAITEGMPQEDLHDMVADDMKDPNKLKDMSMVFYSYKADQLNHLPELYGEFLRIRKEKSAQDIEKMMKDAFSSRDSLVESCVEDYTNRA
ncbi:hypothetical protein VST7929_02191 [Vibrio stylophorae]|uniref:Uncharacterized protein n=1 Tax=Vibrio stylophorae TaxID=659351 RepID=A0ABN8DTY7_9VIBR|nr:hypothetical protein [Vibrio stylophorae]CAH0534275.1 hypothetical protein VST7929_02191 [Vibrio stylophorae]